MIKQMNRILEEIYHMQNSFPNNPEAQKIGAFIKIAFERGRDYQKLFVASSARENEA